jgi:SAM-dependent methyltransferase
MTLVTVPCPLCGGHDFAPIYDRTIDHPDLEAAEYFSSSRARVGHLAVVQCVRCGLWFTNPRDDDVTLAHVYAALQDRAYDSEDVNRRRTARAHLALVERYQSPGRLLDVGCATGIFVDEAHAAGWQVTGLETSAWAVSRARERCPQAVFLNARLEDVDLPDGGFEVVTLWDVLEHVRSPVETLNRVRQWLAPGGWLVLNLPNADSVCARLMGRHWVLLLREHLWYFSPKTMRRLLNAVGFELIQTRTNWVHFSARNVMRRLAQYPGRPGQWAGRAAGWRALTPVSLAFPIGEMNVVARRR